MSGNNILSTNCARDIQGYGETRWSSEKGIALAVAVDETKASQRALKWAVDRLLYKDKKNTLINLVHVRHTLPLTFSFCHDRDNNLLEREPDDLEMEMLRPFRAFCARKKIRYEIVVLEDDDVAQGLVEYAIRHRVENLILGASSRNGLSRLFKHGSGIKSTVIKWIPNFCNVYVISKLGKLNGVRNARRPVPVIPTTAEDHQLTRHHDILSVSRGRGPVSDGVYEESISVSESEIESCTFPSPESTSNTTTNVASPSPDNMFLPFFETLELHLTKLSEPTLSTAIQSHTHFHCAKTSLFLTHKLESMQEKMKKKIKSNQNQTMDMYHVACKEASLAAKEDQGNICPLKQKSRIN